MAEPNTCEILIRLTLPIELTADIDAEATRQRVSIDHMLATMLIDAWRDRQAMKEGLIGGEEIPHEPGPSFTLP